MTERGEEKEIPAWLRTYSTSWVRYAGLMFTMIAPMRAVAYWTSTHSGQLTAQMPTRSPLATPEASSADANSSTSAPNWA